MEEGGDRVIKLCEIYWEMDEDGKERMVKVVEDYLYHQSVKTNENKSNESMGKQV